MKNYKKGFIIPLVWGIVALLAIGLGSYIFINQQAKAPTTNQVENNVATTSDSSVNSQAISSTQNQPLNLNPTSLTDAQFIAAGSDDPQAKVVARGDINGDGYEDAIVQEVHCGASCSIGLQVVFNDHNSSAKLFHSTKYETFEPAYMSSSAAKSEITNISIKNGIISLTGMGLACTPPGTEEACTQEKWNVVRTVTYKFNGTDIVQLSVKSLTQNQNSSNSDKTKASLPVFNIYINKVSSQSNADFQFYPGNTVTINGSGFFVCTNANNCELEIEMGNTPTLLSKTIISLTPSNTISSNKIIFTAPQLNQGTYYLAVHNLATGDLSNAVPITVASNQN